MQGCLRSFHPTVLLAQGYWLKPNQNPTELWEQADLPAQKAQAVLWGQPMPICEDGPSAIRCRSARLSWHCRLCSLRCQYVQAWHGPADFEGLSCAGDMRSGVAQQLPHAKQHAKWSAWVC